MRKLLVESQMSLFLQRFIKYYSRLILNTSSAPLQTKHIRSRPKDNFFNNGNCLGIFFATIFFSQNDDVGSTVFISSLLGENTRMENTLLEIEITRPPLTYFFVKITEMYLHDLAIVLLIQRMYNTLESCIAIK